MTDRDTGTASPRNPLPRLRRKYPWLDHVFVAATTYANRYGNHYAAAITYFSVLSLFPLLMVGFSIAGFVLAGNQTALRELREAILRSAPEGLGDFLSSIVDAALDSRAGVGIFGLLLAFYSGLGWMTNLRDALTAQWGQGKRRVPFLRTKLRDLIALGGLGLALAVSFGLTAVGGTVGNYLLDLTGLQDVAFARFVLWLSTIALALVADVLVFLWVLSRLPRQRVTVRSALRGAVLAAAGFELLKLAGSVYLGAISDTPSGALFGPIIGLLVFANLVSRFVLFVTAWTATAGENVVREIEPPPPAVIRPTVRVTKGAGPGAVLAALGIGVLLGRRGRGRG